MSTSKEAKAAFDRILRIVVEVTDDDNKDDLIKVGTEMGLSDTELHQDFDELYHREEVEEEEESDQDEDDSIEREDNLEIEDYNPTNNDDKE